MLVYIYILLYCYTVVGFPTMQPLTKLGCLQPLTVQSFTFILRTLLRHQNLHVVHAQTDFKRFICAGRLMFLGDYLTQRSSSTGPLMVPCVQYLWEDTACFSHWWVKIMEGLKAQTQSEKVKQHEVIEILFYILLYVISTSTLKNRLGG